MRNFTNQVSRVLMLLCFVLPGWITGAYGQTSFRVHYCSPENVNAWGDAMFDRDPDTGDEIPNQFTIDKSAIHQFGIRKMEGENQVGWYAYPVT